jgi:hypothetical protein
MLANLDNAPRAIRLYCSPKLAAFSLCLSVSSTLAARLFCDTPNSWQSQYGISRKKSGAGGQRPPAGAKVLCCDYMSPSSADWTIGFINRKTSRRAPSRSGAYWTKLCLASPALPSTARPLTHPKWQPKRSRGWPTNPSRRQNRHEPSDPLFMVRESFAIFEAISLKEKADTSAPGRSQR